VSCQNFTSKKIPETEAIFAEIAVVNDQADADPTTLRLSIDGKATIKIGSFDRGGKSAYRPKHLAMTSTLKVQ
jgi:hypothetical protein